MLPLVCLLVCLAGEQPGYDLRTEVPAIDATRWTAAPAPLPVAGQTTRDDYLTFIKRTYQTRRTGRWPSAGNPKTRGQYVDALQASFFWAAEKDEECARMALKFARGDLAYLTEGAGSDKGVGFNVLLPALRMYHRLRDCPLLTDGDRAFFQTWFRTIEQKAERFEYGAMNRSQGWATGRKLLTVLYPEDPLNALRLKYAEEVWNDWWPRRDTFENADGYNALWLTYVVEWLDSAGQEALYQDPGVKALIERLLAQVTPLGPMPFYGDDPGWNNHAGRWIALFERFATVYRDGRFKWAAHRMFEYTVPHEDEMWQWGNINVSTMDDLMDAWLAADDSIAEVKPPVGSLVTWRKALNWLPREVREKTLRHAEVLDQDIPNKLIFRSGWEPSDSFAMVELCPPMGHGHSDAGSIGSYVSQGSVLLSDTPYLVKDHSFHNAFVAQRLPRPTDRWRWRAEEFAGMATRVESFATRDKLACAQVRIDDYMQQPLTLDRRLVFLGDAGLWVHDTVTAKEPYTGLVGPAWQTVATYSPRGESWVNTCQVTLPVAYIWEQKYMMQWHNRPVDLLLWFAPRPDAKLADDDVTHDETRMIVNQPLMNNFRRRLWYQATAELPAGGSRTFQTVLLPHTPTADAGPMAAGIKAELDTPDQAVISARQIDGAVLYAGINQTGKPLRAGPIETDAKWFVIRVDGGRVTERWMVGGK